MANIHTAGIPTMSIGEAVRTLSKTYSKLIQNKVPLQKMPSVMLWGAPGVGKSQGVRQIAHEIGQTTGKRVVMTDVRLLLFNPIDLRGIPTANADKTLAIWLRPQIFQMDPSEEVINILFLDEISAAPQSVQAAAYQITLDRTVGEHKLPDNCIIFAAGNRVTDRSVAVKMPKALANRLLHIEMEVEFESWLQWALQNGIHEKVIGFLSFQRQRLMQFEPSNDDAAFPTPRSWEMVSNILNYVEGSLPKAYPLIAGLIGTGAAAEFRTWERVYATLPSIEDIFDGKMPALPKKTDALYALTSSMTAYAASHSESMERLSNSVRYALRMPADFSSVLLNNYLNISQEFTQTMFRIPEFVKWLNDKGRWLNGSV